MLASIWSKSPTPLLTPPPPDHCHISACGLDLVTPPKNAAQVDVPLRHQPTGAAPKLVVSGSYVHSSVFLISDCVPLPKIEAQIPGSE